MDNYSSSCACIGLEHRGPFGWIVPFSKMCPAAVGKNLHFNTGEYHLPPGIAG